MQKQENLIRTLQIGLIGDSYATKKSEKIASELGKKIAQHNWTLICGGKTGVMQAACKAAVESSGMTVGIIPEKQFDGANKYCKIVIPTGMGFTRNSLVVLSSDIIIMLGGRSGTLNECSFAWFSNKPIIAVSSVKGWSQKLAGKYLDDRRNIPILNAKTANDVINLIKEELKKNKVSKTSDASQE